MAEAARLDDLADSLPPPAEAAAGGGDDVAVADTDAPTETDGPAASDDSTSRGDEDPLGRLLAEWDERNGAGNGAAASGPSDDDIVRLLDEANQQAAHEQEFAAAQQRYAADSARSAMDIAQRDHQVAELQQTVGQLQNAIAQEVARQHQQRSIADFERLAASEQAKLEGLDVDENHVRRWMLAEAAQDPQLREAWDARYYQPPGPLERARIAADIQQWGEGQAKLALQLPASSSAGGREKHSCRDAAAVGDGIPRPGNLSSERSEIRAQGARPNASGGQKTAPGPGSDRRQVGGGSGGSRRINLHTASRSPGQPWPLKRGRVSAAYDGAVWVLNRFGAGILLPVPQRYSSLSDRARLRRGWI